MIKAIETEYNGYKFRSRLEARWAVFFDTVGIDYRYESEGFDLDELGWYLPDFYLPEQKIWVEIKPDVPKLTTPPPYRKTSDRKAIVSKEYDICYHLAKKSNNIVLLIGGTPGYNLSLDQKTFDYSYGIAVFCPDMLCNSAERSPNGLREGGITIWDGAGWSQFNEPFYCLSSYLYGFIYEQYQEHPEYFNSPMPSRGDAWALIEADRQYYRNRYGIEHPSWHYGISGAGMVFDKVHSKIMEYRISLSLPDRDLEYVALGMGTIEKYIPENILGAYQTARQARFEHGETP